MLWPGARLAVGAGKLAMLAVERGLASEEDEGKRGCWLDAKGIAEDEEDVGKPKNGSEEVLSGGSGGEVCILYRSVCRLTGPASTPSSCDNSDTTLNVAMSIFRLRLQS